YCWPYIAYHLLAKRDKIYAKTDSSAVIGGIFLLNTGEYCFHLGVGLLKTDFRFKVSDKIQIMVAEVRTIRCNEQRLPQIYIAARKRKTRVHNSYNDGAFAIQDYRLTDDRGIRSKAVSP